MLPLSIAVVVGAIAVIPSTADALTWVALILVPAGAALASPRLVGLTRGEVRRTRLLERLLEAVLAGHERELEIAAVCRLDENPPRCHIQPSERAPG